MIKARSIKPSLNDKGMNAIEIERLTKSFGSTLAVNEVDLVVPAGMIYGFLGPNGAGKTTLIRMLATLLRPDSGVARIYGYDMVRDADKVRSLVSLTGQFASLDEDITGFENIVLLARLRGFSWSQAKQRANELFEFFDLVDAADRQVKKYSGGMRRRIDIAASLVVQPDLLFLDEPTTGLDPRNRSLIWDIVRTLVSDGITVFLTTQYLDEADQLADRIAVINNGRIIAEGTAGELKSRVGMQSLRLRINDAERRPDAETILTHELGLTVNLQSDPKELSARISESEKAIEALIRLSQSGIGVNSYSFGQPSLDEVFLTLTGHNTKNVSEENQT